MSEHQLLRGIKITRITKMLFMRKPCEIHSKLKYYISLWNFFHGFSNPLKWKMSLKKLTQRDRLIWSSQILAQTQYMFFKEMFGDHSGEFNRYGIRIFGIKVLTIKHWQSKRMFAISEEMDKILLGRFPKGARLF